MTNPLSGSRHRRSLAASHRGGRRASRTTACHVSCGRRGLIAGQSLVTTGAGNVSHLFFPTIEVHRRSGQGSLPGAAPLRRTAGTPFASDFFAPRRAGVLDGMTVIVAAPTRRGPTRVPAARITSGLVATVIFLTAIAPL